MNGFRTLKSYHKLEETLEENYVSEVVVPLIAMKLIRIIFRRASLFLRFISCRTDSDLRHGKFITELDLLASS